MLQSIIEKTYLFLQMYADDLHLKKRNIDERIGLFYDSIIRDVLREIPFDFATRIEVLPTVGVRKDGKYVNLAPSGMVAVCRIFNQQNKNMVYQEVYVPYYKGSCLLTQDKLCSIIYRTVDALDQKDIPQTFIDLSAAMLAHAVIGPYIRSNLNSLCITLRRRARKEESKKDWWSYATYVND